MLDEGQSALIILDPSVVFTDEALGWLSDDEIRQHLVVSQALYERLENPEAGEQFAPWDATPDPQRVFEVRNALEGLPKFSFNDAGELPEEARRVLGALLDERRAELGDVVAEIAADEWAFLSSQSWAALRARVRTTIDAFVLAGVHVYEVTRDQINEWLDAVREAIPDSVLDRMKFANEHPILIAGGIHAIQALAHLHGVPLEIAESVQLGNGALAGDP